MGRLYHLKRVLWLGVVFAAAVSTSAAQQPDDLQKQVEQLKQQYEQTTREMQQRISSLEQQIAEQKANSEKAKQGTVSWSSWPPSKQLKKRRSDSPIKSAQN